MGLFGNLKKKARSGSLFDSFAAAQATLAGDYGGAANIYRQGANQRHDNQLQDQQLRIKQEARNYAYQAAKARGYSEVDAQALANDPATIASIIQQATQDRQGGAEGMTIRHVDPASGAATYETSPGWHDGSYFGGSNGTAIPPIIRDVPKIVPVTQGGGFEAFGGASGRHIPRRELEGGLLPGQSGAAGPTAGVAAASPSVMAPRLPPYSPDNVFASIIQQESGGRPGVLGSRSRYGTPVGMTQMLPATAQAMASKLGLPWQPQLMTGTTPEAADYQRQLGRAYYDEGMQAEGGDPRRAAMYYHGGPNHRQWGPKTRRYADQVMHRAGRTSQTPQPGQEVDGYVYQGGDPNSPRSWRPAR